MIKPRLVNPKLISETLIPKILVVFVFLFISFTAFSQNCTVNAGIDKTICVGSSVILEGNIGGSYIGPNTVLWTQVSGPGAATITVNNSLSPTISNFIVGVYVFQIQAACQVGGNATDQVSITVIAGATAVTHPSITYPGCYTPGTPIALTGIAPAGHTLTWSVVTNSAPVTATFNGPTNGSFTGNSPTIQFPAPPSSHCNNGSDFATIRIVSSNISTGCTTERNFTISYRYLPQNVYAYVYPNPVCGSCANLVGSCAQGGTGTWTVVSAPAGAPAATWSPNNTSNLVRACNLITGTYTFRWTVGGAACMTGSSDVTVAVNNSGSPSTTIPVADSKIFCPGTLPSTISLDGNLPAIGETVTWTQVGGPAVTITNANSPFATVSGLTEAGAPYMFSYMISSGNGCDKVDTMLVKVMSPITTGVRSNSYCSASNIGGTGTGVDIIIPYMHSDSVKVTFTYVSGPLPTVNISNSGTLFSPSFTVIGSIASQTNTLNAGSSFTRTYLSSVIWPNSIPSNAYLNYSLRPPSTGPCQRLLPGIYNFSVTLQDQCSTYVYPPFSTSIGISDFNANAGSDQILTCGTTSTTLAGNLMPCNAIPYWTTINKPTGAMDPINAGNMYNANAALVNLQDGNYSFVWRADNGSVLGCNIKQDTVRITVSTAPPAVPVITGGGAFCNIQPVNITASLPFNAAGGVWSVTTTPSGGTYTITPSISSPNIIFTPSTLNTSYTLTWTVTNGCGTAFANTIVSTNGNTAVVPDIVNPTCQFGGAFGNLSATPSPLPVGVWTSNNPNYTITTPNATTTTISPAGPQNNRGPVTFYYTLDNIATGGCGVLRDSVTFLAGYSTSTITASNQCNVSSFPVSIPVTFTNMTPYQVYNLYVTGPGSPTLSNYQINLTGSGYQTTVVNLNVSMPGTYIVGFSNIQSGECSDNSAIKSINIQVSEPGPLAVAGPDINLCGTNNSVALNAQPNPLGTSNGVWSIQTVYSGFAPSFSNTTSSNPTVSFNNGGGDVLLKWEVRGSNPNCTGGASDYQRIRYVPAANAGRDDFTCYDASASPASMVLSGNKNTAGTGSWSIVSQPVGSTASFINASLPTTTITGLINGAYQLRWTITDPSGTCPATTDDLNILVYFGCQTVPLELKTFTAQRVNNNVNVFWEMSTEEEGTKYILERALSPQGPFASIAWVDYNQSANGKYSNTDLSVEKLGSKYIYYRLKMLDKNNKVAYSKVAVVNAGGLQSMHVYPSIVNRGEPVNIVVAGNQPGALEWRLVSTSGQFIRKQTMGQGRAVQINTGNLAKGSYILQINGSEKTLAYKILIK